MQKSITSGRSSYVEMRAASRVFDYNCLPTSEFNDVTFYRYYILKVNEFIFWHGYEYILTPNGILKRNDLEKLLSLDPDIGLLLMSIDRSLRCEVEPEIDSDLDNLQELVNSRKRFIQIIKA
jgi:hypothetical protein